MRSRVSAQGAETTDSEPFSLPQRPIRMTRRPLSVRLTLVACIALGACGSTGPDEQDSSLVTSDVSAVPPSATDPGTVEFESPVGTGSIEPVDHRLLIDDAAIGDAYTVEILTPDEVWAIDPDAEIAVDDEVLIRFTLAESSSCRFGPFVDLAFDTDSRLLYPIVTPFWDGRPDDDTEYTCFDDGVPHTVVVAVLRESLPSGAFDVWVDGDGWSPALAGNVLRIAPGELRAPDEDELALESLGPDGSLPLGQSRVVLRASTHCGFERLFLEIDGDQWTVVDRAVTVDGVPEAWVEFQRGQEIDLVVERTGTGELTVTALGSDVAQTYERASDDEGCA